MCCARVSGESHRYTPVWACMRPNAIFFLLQCGAKPQNYGLVLACSSLSCNPGALNLSRNCISQTEPKNLLICWEVTSIRWRQGNPPPYWSMESCEGKSTSTVTPGHKYGKLGKDKNWKMGCSDANLKICRWNFLFSFAMLGDRCLNFEYFLSNFCGLR